MWIYFCCLASKFTFYLRNVLNERIWYTWYFFCGLSERHLYLITIETCTLSHWCGTRFLSCSCKECRANRNWRTQQSARTVQSPTVSLQQGLGSIQGGWVELFTQRLTFVQHAASHAPRCQISFCGLEFSGDHCNALETSSVLKPAVNFSVPYIRKTLAWKWSHWNPRAIRKRNTKNVSSKAGYTCIYNSSALSGKQADSERAKNTVYGKLKMKIEFIQKKITSCVQNLDWS